MSIDTQPQEKTPKEWLDALRVGKIWNEKTPRCSPPTFAADGTFAKGCTKQTKRLHTASFFISFYVRSNIIWAPKRAIFTRNTPLRGCAYTFANAANKKMRRRPGKQPQFIRSQRLFIPLTAYSSSRSHHCASERGATRRRTSARGGRKPAASPRRLRGRCFPRAAGAGFRR